MRTLATLVLLSAAASAQDQPLLTDYVKASISVPPAPLGYDAFYKKYTDALGIPIVASDRPPDMALLVARDIVNQMLSKRSDLRAALIARKWRIVVMAQSEMTTDVPEHRNLKKPANIQNSQTDKEYWDGRARGLGGNPTSCAEENLLGYPGTRYYGENILVHEFAHAILNGGVRQAEPELYKEVVAAYEAAMKDGKYKGHYASTNPNEYWAEGTQWWFFSNYAHTFGETRVSSPEDLRAYDPVLFNLLARVYPDHRIPMDIYHAKEIPPRRRPAQ
ncbi:MAG TPA: glycoside hydrolase [Solibacterales bacterium]|nr:glycoside hydrolase [Bryobacterales bacterium]